MRAKQISSIVGLSLEDGRLGLCHLQRSGGRIRVVKSLKFPLALDPLNDEPELLGQEIRNRLDEAGIHERTCAVCLPLKWIITLHTELPNLPSADLDSYVTLQAERSFPFSLEDLAIAESRLALEGGKGLATLAALSKPNLGKLQSLLKAAGLRPVALTVATATLPMEEPGGVLLAGENGLDLAVIAGGGVAALRSLEEAAQRGPEGTRWDEELIMRQLRITLGRLPREVRGGIQSIGIQGVAEQVRILSDLLRESLAALGLKIRKPPSAPGEADKAPAAWSPAYAVAECCLAGRRPVFDFLPPRVSRLKRLAGRFSARRTLYLGGGAIAILILAGTFFILQGLRLRGLEREWTLMKPKVERVEALQANVRQFRPWFDGSAPSLTIAASMAKAFPEEGTVWVKKIQIKDLSTIVCMGNARTNEDWLGLLGALRRSPGVADLQVTQVRGNQPLQFSLSFHWKGEGPDGL